MIYGVLVGAMIFNYFSAASNPAEHLTTGLRASACLQGHYTVIIVIYIILGALMDEVLHPAHNTAYL
jgi:hypothetical protein